MHRIRQVQHVYIMTTDSFIVPRTRVCDSETAVEGCTIGVEHIPLLPSLPVSSMRKGSHAYTRRLGLNVEA